MGSSPVTPTIYEVKLCYSNHAVGVVISYRTALHTVRPVVRSWRPRERLGSESPGSRVIGSITRREILSTNDSITPARGERYPLSGCKTTDIFVCGVRRSRRKSITLSRYKLLRDGRGGWIMITSGLSVTHATTDDMVGSQVKGNALGGPERLSKSVLFLGI